MSKKSDRHKEMALAEEPIVEGSDDTTYKKYSRAISQVVTEFKENSPKCLSELLKDRIAEEMALLRVLFIQKATDLGLSGGIANALFDYLEQVGTQSRYSPPKQ